MIINITNEGIIDNLRKYKAINSISNYDIVIEEILKQFFDEHADGLEVWF